MGGTFADEMRGKRVQARDNSKLPCFSLFDSIEAARCGQSRARAAVCLWLVLFVLGTVEDKESRIRTRSTAESETCGFSEANLPGMMIPGDQCGFSSVLPQRSGGFISF